MKTHFNRSTFRYFDLAQKNKNSKAWYEKNKELYLEQVRAPFEELIRSLSAELSPLLPRIHIDPKSICRPLRPAQRAGEGGLVKNFSHITIWEKKTSLFEWNPGIHIQFGAGKEDNLVGVGLYMVSSRQMSLLRNRLVEDFDEVDELLNDKKLKKSWGVLAGERFKRFPKGFNPEDPRTTYLWHKQFYLSQNFSRSDVMDKNFSKNLTKDLKAALPFLMWVRQAVGVYRKSSVD